ncbi:flagellar biosynthesis anti-sigma factor FlgM [Chlamydiota bacterium]
MEINGITTIQTLNKASPKEGVQAARIEDKVTISSDAKKRAEWVEILKQMPDVRPEKIVAALSHPTVSAAQLAERMIQSGF